jgi:hypothetical protein
MDKLTALIFVAMFLLVSHLQGGVQAYLDPNTGSMAIQLLLAGVVAFLATARSYRDRIRAFFVRRRTTPEGPDTSERL